VRQLFYWAAGETAPFLGPFDQAVYDEVAPNVWAYLNELEPHLWRSGQTYPELAAMADLLSNGEIDFSMEYDANRASNYIAQGRYPETIRTFVPQSGSVANISYVAIPYNAANPAGAMVVANFLLSPEYQLQMAKPSPWGWMMAIDPMRLPQELQAAAGQDGERGAATLAPEVLAGAALPEMAADWVSAIDAGWVANVLEK
jgi:putative spermidine/putrescine transport system substrate-binding protein